jgi:hypothetical protein
MNKLELAIAIAADIGMNKTFTYKALIALQQQLDAHGFAGRAVVWDGFGTFFQPAVLHLQAKTPPLALKRCLTPCNCG